MSLLTQVFVTETLILSLYNTNEFLEGDIYNIIFFLDQQFIMQST